MMNVPKKITAALVTLNLLTVNSNPAAGEHIAGASARATAAVRGLDKG